MTGHQVPSRRSTDPPTGRRGRRPGEVKAASRRALLDAALKILDEEGEAALSTMRVARVAGFAQPSFYVHFENMADLLRSLVAEVLDEWRSAVLDSRRESRDAPDDPERFRDTFRSPISRFLEHPEVFRLVLRARHDHSSPLGDWSRAVHDQQRQELVDDLVAAGFPRRTPADRRRLAIVADGIVGMTAETVLGLLDGRYRDVEEVVDVLVAFSQGYLGLRPDDAGRRRTR